MGRRIDDTAETMSDCDIIDSFHDLILAGEKLTAAFHRRMPSMDGHGLTPFVLRSIEAAGRQGLSQVEIARQLHRSSSSATRLIDGLEQAGIVIRSPHPHDRRIKLVTLTEHGKLILNGIFDDLTRNADIIRSLQKSDVDAFRSKMLQSANIVDQNI